MSRWKIFWIWKGKGLYWNFLATFLFSEECTSKEELHSAVRIKLVWTKLLIPIYFLILMANPSSGSSAWISLNLLEYTIPSEPNEKISLLSSSLKICPFRRTQLPLLMPQFPIRICPSMNLMLPLCNRSLLKNPLNWMPEKWEKVPSYKDLFSKNPLKWEESPMVRVPWP